MSRRRGTRSTGGGDVPAAGGVYARDSFEHNEDSIETDAVLH